MDQQIVIDTVKDLLPEIEQELRDQVMHELQYEYADKFRQEVEKITHLDVEQIRQQLEFELRKEFSQQRESLADTIIKEFDEQFVNGQMEQKLRLKIREEMDSKVTEELLKRQRQLKVQYKKKIEQEKQQLMKSFEMEWKQKVESNKKQLEREKSEIARMKSVEYVKLKKLQDEKKLYSQFLKDQEQKYQEIVQSLQKQVQDLTQVLEQTLQKQVQESTELKYSIQQSSIIGSKYEAPQQIKPIYDHHQTEESYVDQTEIRYSPKSVQSMSLKSKTSTVKQSMYQQELIKAKPKQKNISVKTSEEQNKENNNKLNKYNNIVQQKAKEDINEVYDNYENFFIESDLDNSKNKQMKQERKQMIDDKNKDFKLQSKYQALQINIMNEFIQDYDQCPEYHEVKCHYQELFENWNNWKISFQERIDVLKTTKQLSKPNTLKDILPYLQTQNHSFKLIHNKLQLFKQRLQLKQDIQSKFSSFSVAKDKFDKLQLLNKQLDTINISVQGVQFQDQLKMDLQERDFLEREELKIQLLQKIQSKLL